MRYKVKLIKEYIELADSKEEAIESAKFHFDYSNDSSFCQQWDKVQCTELSVLRCNSFSGCNSRCTDQGGTQPAINIKTIKEKR